MDPDEVDEQLVRALQVDGRASYEALARMVGLARSTTKARVRRLLDEGGLRLIGAVHPAALGLNQLGHVIIEADGPAQPVAERVAELDETSFVTTTAGRFALTAELRTPTLDAFSRGLARVQAVEGVRSVQTATYLQIWKDPYFPPGPLESPGPLDDIDLDPSDHALIEHLRVDGRASFADLAGVTGLSAGATRARLLRLLDSGVVHVGALVRLNPLSHTHTIGFALSLSGETAPVAREVVELDEVDSFATGIGWCNGIGTIRANSHDGVFATLERLRSLPGVRAVESWAHLRAIKEEHDLARPLAGNVRGRVAGR
ncbi:DNA-binding Lrp family transcriptional regulator [Saccharopolyspora lacisalsi]|uniref:DNA-binding Lrp family transcriptional regulator n=1 Tax=Halosaccharopolyspora lacisalsi TaxID=1000566 RepID=A0A839E2Z0_9PSEU|nr:Lrp/AsnC family transcriptional regulator [Halosaccharopolyspora lacisalsi]MBA8826125.1 DNA-binding Lrp family transcriptional regulator [Halosaccharopolyspora lacisalsi]